MIIGLSSVLYPLSYRSAQIIVIGEIDMILFVLYINISLLMALSAATRQMYPRFVSKTLSVFMCAQSVSVVFDLVNGSRCDWFCAAVRLLTLSCFPFSRVLLLKHNQPSILFIIESHKQFPLAAFNLPARRFSPWRNAFEGLQSTTKI